MDDEKLECGICGINKYHDEGMYGGYDSMDEDESEYCGVEKMLKKFPHILKNDDVVCGDCLNKHC